MTMNERISQAVIIKGTASKSTLVEMWQQSDNKKSATKGKYHFNHPKLGFVFKLNATEHAQFHAVFQCKDQDYKFVIHSMSDTSIQFCWKCVLESKQNFKLTYYPKYSIFLLKHPNCTDSRTQWFNPGQKFQHSPRFLWKITRRNRPYTPIPLDGDLWRSARSERAPWIALVWGDLGVPVIRLRPISAPMAS